MSLESREYHERLRDTSKAIIIVEDYDYGPCILLGKEKNGKYGLFGWWINKGETPEQGLQREIKEELGMNITQKKHLKIFNTKSQKVHLYTIQVDGKYLKLSKEHKGIQIYPLNKDFKNEREAVESNMEYNAKEAIKIFRNKYNYKDFRKSPIDSLTSWVRFFEDQRHSTPMINEMKELLAKLGLKSTLKKFRQRIRRVLKDMSLIQ